MTNSLFPLPTRSAKPRNNGITMMIDSGLGIQQIKDVLAMGEDLIDYVKLGWGTALVTKNLEEKVKLYQSHGINVCLGGTLFEICFVHGKIDAYKSFVESLGIKYVEISDGTIEIPREEKLKNIEQLSKDFTVLSEYGSKLADVMKAPHHWARHMLEELDAGAWKVIGEGRESGTAGMYRGSSELRTGLVEELIDSINVDDIIWEAPKKEHQSWFIKKFGSNVNLGNIAFKDIIPLETLRLGLRSDTLVKFHVEDNGNK